MNDNLQEANHLVIEMCKKIMSFKRKVHLCEVYFPSNSKTHFPNPKSEMQGRNSASTELNFCSQGIC
jgi:hypothetical protein